MECGGLICGAVIAMILGFAWGGWTTSGTTQTMTKEAVLASQAAICVAQFMKQPNHEAKLKELEAVSSWQRAEVIEKGGWDKMPGKKRLAMLSPEHAPMGLSFFQEVDWPVKPKLGNAMLNDVLAVGVAGVMVVVIATILGAVELLWKAVAARPTGTGPP